MHDKKLSKKITIVRVDKLNSIKGLKGYLCDKSSEYTRKYRTVDHIKKMALIFQILRIALI